MARECLNKQCPFFMGSGRPAEFMDDETRCSYCGGRLTKLRSSPAAPSWTETEWEGETPLAEDPWEPEALPPIDWDKGSKLVPLVTVEAATEALVLASLLQSYDVPVLEREDTKVPLLRRLTNILPMAPHIHLELCVPAHSYARARFILEEARRALEDGADVDGWDEDEF
jgi:hypothetical protein